MFVNPYNPNDWDSQISLIVQSTSVGIKKDNTAITKKKRLKKKQVKKGGYKTHPW